MTTALKEKIKEALMSVLPIAAIIFALSVTVAPLDTGTFVLFLLGVALLILGMGCFTLGADMSMLVIGEKIGSSVTQSRKIWLIALVSFIIGMIVTVAEPDLQILAAQVGSLSGKTFLGNYLLILTVAVGVGVFLTIAMLRIVFHVRLSVLLIFFYAVAFVLSVFVSPSFWAVSFDSGGVTTGPMTVPFIMSLGVGVASIRSDGKGQDDSFGLVALSSVGPVVAVLALGIFFKIERLDYSYLPLVPVTNTHSALFLYLRGFSSYATEALVALAPILVFFLGFQLFTRAFRKRRLVRILFGFLYTFLGLVLFLTGANVGFMPVGRILGERLASLWGGWLLIPVGMLIGYFVVAAEPAVHVLNKQVELISAGAITARSMKRGLCAGVCISLGLAMLRILTGINIMWILIPGYAAALVLTFFTPPMFTGVAFDSGGVASGAMVSSFVLPLAVGACYTLRGGSAFIMTDAFGCVAFVALTPLISIQILGVLYRRKTRRIKRDFLSGEDRILDYEVDE